MQMIERIPVLEGKTATRWQQVVLESVLAIVGALAVTALIYGFQLYPRIPNISILYLLVILPLASVYGLYAASLASVVAFLAFDFFLVPPLYTFTIDRWEEWIALFVFLATALLTSELALIMRQRAFLAQRRERESRILYELIRLATTQERVEEQLSVVVQSIVRVFAAWGVQACAILLPDVQGTLMLMSDAVLEGDEFVLSAEERALAVSVMTQGRMLEKREGPQPDYKDTESRISQYSSIGPISLLRLIPLKSGEEVLGVLCLRVHKPAPWFASDVRMREEQTLPNSRVDFFWTFVAQATSIIERAHLRSEISTSANGPKL